MPYSWCGLYIYLEMFCKITMEQMKQFGCFLCSLLGLQWTILIFLFWSIMFSKLKKLTQPTYIYIYFHLYNSHSQSYHSNLRLLLSFLQKVYLFPLPGLLPFLLVDCFFFQELWHNLQRKWIKKTDFLYLPIWCE